jgi:hypothetical protein
VEVRRLLRRVIIWALTDPESIRREQERAAALYRAVVDSLRATEHRWSERTDVN